MEARKKILVVGNGMVSIRFCEQLIEYNAHKTYEVMVLGDEPLPAYDRVALSSIFGPKPEGELIFAEERWYKFQKIGLQLNTRVTSIDRENKQVSTNTDETFDYDYLVLATGSRATVPPIPGVDLKNVFVYRTMKDTQDIKEAAAGRKNSVVVGGGLLGLEAAEISRELKLDVKVLERAPHLMPAQLDPESGALLQESVEEIGIHVLTDAKIDKLVGTETVESVLLEDGTELPADLVILATGITPNDELATQANIETGKFGGIVIDKFTKTSDPSIFAIGECVSFKDKTFGLIAPGYAMAATTAAILAGVEKEFTLDGNASQLKLLDLEVACLGNSTLPREGTFPIVMKDLEKGVYKKIIFDDARKKILGAILIGETSEFDRLRKRIGGNEPLPAPLSDLLAPIGKPFTPEVDMEDDEIVCFCNYVSFGDIKKAINTQGLTTTQEVMGATYAGGLCGSCLGSVDAITKHLVAEAGNQQKI